MKKIYISRRVAGKVLIAALIVAAGLSVHHFSKTGGDEVSVETSSAVSGPSQASQGLEQEEAAAALDSQSVEGEDSARKEREASSSEASDSQMAEESAKLLGVHVTGAVKNPDRVYYLPEGSRIEDAISQAGGATEEADLSRLNLADYVRDSQQIYVPVKGEEIPELAGADSDGRQSGKEDEQVAQEGSGEENGLTNLNTATKIELMELPGIGEATADRIIAYRDESGPFTSIEELMQVKGIGESKFETLKAYITV